MRRTTGSDKIGRTNGNKLEVITCLDVDTYNILEEMRGKTPRSTWVRMLIEECLNPMQNENLRIEIPNGTL